MKTQYVSKNLILKYIDGRRLHVTVNSQEEENSVHKYHDEYLDRVVTAEYHAGHFNSCRLYRKLRIEEEKL